jgi:hypothetical protein
MEKFIDSGRFTRRMAFLDKNPNEKLLDNCTDVVQYIGGAYIQVLQSGLFYLDENHSSKVLDEVEVELFGKINVK